MRMLDLFAGVGGFHLAFEQIGLEFDWVGFSEIDKHASAVYKHRFPKAVELGDVTAIQPKRDLPDHIDILCGGFPCQSFSLAGKRDINDTRGTLFYEIARILAHYRDKGRPIPYLLLENVKGLYSHDDYATFAKIHGVLTDLGYTTEVELLNTRNFSVPQNRERIFFAGYLGERGGFKVFPIGESSSQDNQTQRIGDHTRTITTAHSHGTSTNMSYVKMHTTHPRTGDKKGGGGGPLSRDDGNTYCLDTSNSQAVEIQPVLTPKRAKKRQNGRRFKEDGEDMFTLTGQDQHGVMVYDHYNDKIKSDGVACSLLKHSSNSRSTQKIINNHSIRRLTPVETCRLQSFPDHWNKYGNYDGQIRPMSDTQRYKQMGNSVTVRVVMEIAKKIKNLIKEEVS